MENTIEIVKGSPESEYFVGSSGISENEALEEGNSWRAMSNVFVSVYWFGDGAVVKLLDWFLGCDLNGELLNPATICNVNSEVRLHVRPYNHQDINYTLGNRSFQRHWHVCRTKDYLTADNGKIVMWKGLLLLCYLFVEKDPNEN